MNIRKEGVMSVRRAVVVVNWVDRVVSKSEV
jgi:hypothetical protein